MCRCVAVGSLYEGVLAGLCAPSTSQVSVAKHAPWRPVWRFFAAGKDTSVPDSPQPGLREFLDIIPEDGADKIPTGTFHYTQGDSLSSYPLCHQAYRSDVWVRWHLLVNRFRRQYFAGVHELLLPCAQGVPGWHQSCDSRALTTCTACGSSA